MITSKKITNERDEIAKLQKGEFTITSFMNTMLKKSKETAIEEHLEKIKTLTEEKEATKKLYSFALRMLKSTIESFKLRELQRYRQFVKTFAKSQKDLFTPVSKIWKDLHEVEN